MNQRAKPRGRRAGGGQDLTTADLVVLSLLAERPMHGYDLLAEYQRQEVADWASISKAQLYYALKKLNGRRFLKATMEGGAGRDRTVYQPSIAGLRALADGLADPSWAQGRVAQPFTTWFGLSIHADADARLTILRSRLGFLEGEIAKEQRSLAYIATLRDERAIKGADIVRLAIGQLQVEREWVEGLLGREL